VVANLQGLERCDSHLSYRANIAMRLVPDNNLWVHSLTSLFLAGQSFLNLTFRPDNLILLTRQINIYKLAVI
jgi:hypothetical protein